MTEAEKSLKRGQKLQMIRAWVDLVTNHLHFVLKEMFDEDVDGVCHPVEEGWKYLQL